MSAPLLPPGVPTPARGWLKNQARRERRDRQFTLTENDIDALLEKIGGGQPYTKLDPETDKMFRLRDAALICAAWIFFKRGNEDLPLRLEDISVADGRLSVTFEIEKKRTYFLICSSCGFKNQRRSKMKKDGSEALCGKCETSLRNAMPHTEKEMLRTTKRKTLRYKYTKPIVDWYRVALIANGENKKAWFFPPFKFFGKEFLWNSEKPMSIQNFDYLLQRLDPSLSSCMFRYGRTEVLADAKDKKGRHLYSMRDLTILGDWNSEYMPTLYAKRKGLTETAQRFEEDAFH